MSDIYRTHNCCTLTKKNIGESVTLSGWVDRFRDHGGLIFIDLRDRFGLTQIVFDPEKNKQAHSIAETLRSEWVISVKGTVIPRSEGMANSNLYTGDIEVEATDVEILSKAKTPPFSVCDEFINVNEELRLKYRYLDIRRGDVMKNLVVRHKAMMATRRYFDSQGFLEIHTPYLAKSTPEGARDYLVPSRIHPGNFYALPQSPQLFKQLLMIGGADRYFQIVPCFRDEDLRADRQPEFTQIDYEMSFGTVEQIQTITENLLKAVFKECLDIEIPTPFPRIPHAECMAKYGTDRPDLRFGMEFVDVSDIAEASEFSVFKDQIKGGGLVKGICVKGGADLSRKMIDGYTEFVGQFGIKGLAWMKMQAEGLASNIVKFFSADQQQELIKRFECEEGDLIFMVADHPSRVNQGLDHLRRQLAKDRNLINPKVFRFLWVVDFPLFNWNPDEQRMESEHHPFTSVHPEDATLLDSDPLKARSLAYDVVLNGSEIGGGSKRIHDTEMQSKIFKLLNISEEKMKQKFGFFLDAMSYGTPPHLGLALGLDRLIMLLCGTDNIRDVIAFPKTKNASDLMLECPSPVAPEQLEELTLNIRSEQTDKQLF